ncbi:threonine/serine exporter family protein [Streptococcus danieliae]|uniref:Threonine/serine exporter n=1 Tax=Streptococcus danieliae TaxID=747656 RepID=A0A7Z0LDE7_9STRE|nr:threonine/serine exporter family protein [Streptococcus danieliae]MBF0699849.1 threonine/serine exporter family protein [Streptococcus danieliae]MBF0717296.1 threonine/serine exporter family protein [Streptococcus danieliae]MBF0844941.1 threonine/serine exporter family protein [Streptococcus danieliae]MCU0082437.1 threonine/serine exporter family protein [Streptococcus danieliae]MVX59477.1 threonine/serine exporter [Streptococcus danieliae]
MSFFLGFLLSLCGSLGYGMMVNAPRQTLLSSALTGGLAWIAYLLILDLTGGIWLANLVASLMIGVLSNVFAKRIGTPVNILSIPCMISLVPGGTIATSMRYFAQGDVLQGQSFFVRTLLICFSLALGFVLAEGLVFLGRKIGKR